MYYRRSYDVDLSKKEGLSINHIHADALSAPHGLAAQTEVVA